MVDDLAARQAAQKQGLQIIGLLGILGEGGGAVGSIFQQD